MKHILDVTCGDRTIWFQKNEPHTIYCDKRREEWEGEFGNVLNRYGKRRNGILLSIRTFNAISQTFRFRTTRSIWSCSIRHISRICRRTHGCGKVTVHLTEIGVR